MNHNISLAKLINPTIKNIVSLIDGRATDGRVSDAELDTLFGEVFNDKDYEAQLSQAPLWKEVNEGDLVLGTVVSLRTDIVLIDYGNKSEGFLPFKEGDFVNSDLDVGDQIKVVVTEVTDEGKVMLSRELVPEIEKQHQLFKSLKIGDRILGTVTEISMTGTFLDVQGLMVFLPKAHSGPLPGIGAEIEVEVVKCEAFDNVIVSRKAILEAARQESKGKFIASLQVGDTVSGTVKSLTNFGAFIDIGSSIIGLCHISDISFDRIEHPKEVLQLGQKIQAKILKIERDKNRVTLGIKQTQHLSWDKFMTKHTINDKVTGKVVSILKYGAFIEIEPGIQGLIHISEMSWSDHVRHPGDMLKVGDTVEVVILGTDSKNRLALGLKQTQSDPWSLAEDKYFPGCLVEGRIAHKTQYGFFVELEKDIDGFLNFKDAKSLDVTSLKIDDMLTVSITRVDTVNKRISLCVD